MVGHLSLKYNKLFYFVHLGIVKIPVAYSLFIGSGSEERTLFTNMTVMVSRIVLELDALAIA